MARIRRPDILWSVNKLARAVAKWAQACDRRLARFIPTCITPVTTANVVMWVTRHSIVDWAYFKTQTLLVILKTRNQLQGEYFVHLEVEHSSLKTGCVRNRLRYLTAPLNQWDSKLYTFENDQAVIKMTIKARSPSMRHVSRTNRVALNWFFDRINFDPKIQIRYVDAKNQLADILTKGSFSKMHGTICFVC